MAMLETHLATTRRIQTFRLEVLESNVSARRLYTRLGYKELGAPERRYHPDGAAIDVVTMEKLWSHTA